MPEFELKSVNGFVLTAQTYETSLPRTFNLDVVQDERTLLKGLVHGVGVVHSLIDGIGYVVLNANHENRSTLTELPVDLNRYNVRVTYGRQVSDISVFTSKVSVYPSDSDPQPWFVIKANNYQLELFSDFLTRLL